MSYGVTRPRWATRCWPRCAGNGSTDIAHRVGVRAEERVDSELMKYAMKVMGKTKLSLPGQKSPFALPATGRFGTLLFAKLPEVRAEKQSYHPQGTETILCDGEINGLCRCDRHALFTLA